MLRRALSSLPALPGSTSDVVGRTPTLRLVEVSAVQLAQQLEEALGLLRVRHAGRGRGLPGLDRVYHPSRRIWHRGKVPMEKSVPGESDIKEVLFKRASSAYTEKVSVLGQAVR